MRKITKRGQSQIVSTVLLILISITAVMIVIGFVVPFIKKQLSGTDCLEVSGKIEIKNNLKYTCYDLENNQMRVQVHMGDVGNVTKGFQLSIDVEGSTKAFEITKDSDTIENLNMYGSTIENPIELRIPQRGGEVTYVISNVNSKPDSITAYPILNNDKMCEASDTLTEINICPTI